MEKREDLVRRTVVYTDDKQESYATVTKHAWKEPCCIACIFSSVEAGIIGARTNDFYERHNQFATARMACSQEFYPSNGILRKKNMTGNDVFKKLP